MKVDDSLFDLILGRIQQENEKNVRANLDAAVKASLNTWTSAGNFYDVDYLDTSITNWKPLAHINRLYDFVFAYTLPHSSYYRDEGLYDKIVAGLQYWYQRNPSSANWWYNQIGEPQPLGLILIQMRKGVRQLPQELESKTLERMRRDGGDPAKQTGANKTDIALHWLYRAILIKDGALLAKTISYAYEPLVLVSGEGIQYDYAYFQHGNQLYIIGYGTEFIKGVTIFAMYTAGTTFALSGEKLDIFSKFIRDSYLPAIRGQYALFSLGGRGGLSRQGGSRKTSAARYIERMRSIDPDNVAVYDDAIQRLQGKQPARYGIAPNHVHYPIGDYTLHTRPGWAFDVRMVSNRTMRIETGNEENLKTYYASDGSTNIVRRGDEYNEIFPVWNWTRVPGITCAQVSSIPRPRNWGIYGTSAFAGGVSDSLYGVTAYSYNADYTGNSAQKAWFFFDDEVVCLGSGITSSDSVSEYDINTTINQCLLQGDVTVSSQGNLFTLDKGEHTYQTAPDWILHDGVGYCFPQGGTIEVSNKSQTGNWHDINLAQPNRPVTKNVFTLWLNHGKKAVNGKYAYIVVPDKNTIEEMDAYHQNSNVVIAANTESMQAVYHRGLDILGLVFYQAGVFEYNDIKIQTDKACTILFRDTKTAKVTMYVADPAQMKSQITILAKFPAVSPATGKIVCDFSNTGVFAGATKIYTIGVNSR